jgi:Golgi nucleoside diphosphatase
MSLGEDGVLVLVLVIVVHQYIQRVDRGECGACVNVINVKNTRRKNCLSQNMLIRTINRNRNSKNK